MILNRLSRSHTLYEFVLTGAFLLIVHVPHFYKYRESENVMTFKVIYDNVDSQSVSIVLASQPCFTPFLRYYQ